VTTRYAGERAPDDVIDAALGASGVWLLLNRRTDSQEAVLARVDAPGHIEPVATWPRGANGSNGSITAIAPDDSLLAASATGELLVDAASGCVTPLRGDLLGFVPSSSADTWHGEQFRTIDPTASTPPPPPVPTMQPFDAIVAQQLTPADRELWRGEHLAVEGPGSSPSVIEIGPIAFEEGIGIFLACDGPSDVLVTGQSTDGSHPPLVPLLSRCLAADELAGGHVPAACIRASVRFRVTSTPDTSWRLLIFDPAPESPAP
jgi:hypothetical protein